MFTMTPPSSKRVDKSTDRDVDGVMFGIGIAIVVAAFIGYVILTVVGIQKYDAKTDAFIAKIDAVKVAQNQIDTTMTKYPQGALQRGTVVELDENHYVGRVQFGTVTRVCDFAPKNTEMTCRGGIPTVTVS